MTRLPLFQRVRVVDLATRHTRECHLVKYADKQYSTIKIGTLVGYQAMEGCQADPLEGRIRGTALYGPRQTMSSEEFHRTMRAPNFRIYARDGIVIGPSGTIRDDKPRAFPNVFVFCCSMVFGAFPDRTRLEHFGATTVSVIGDPEALGREVARKLLGDGKTSAGDRLSSESHEILFKHGPVTYAPREPAAVTPELNDAELFVFQKSERFRLEQEYRLAWMIVDRKTGGIVPVQPEPVLIEGSWATGVCSVPSRR